jgi:putative tricarboxylic transport membrane protein
MGRDGYTGLVVIAASLAFFWGTLGLERHPMVPVGPAFYPRIVLGLTAVMGFAMLVADLWRHRRLATGGGVAKPAGAARNYGLVVLCFAIFTAYVVALPYLGFRMATFLFLVAMPFVLERPRSPRAWVIVLMVAAVATAASYMVFEHYLHVLLPRGRWTSF